MNWGPATLIVGGYLVSLLFQFKLTDGLNRRIDDVNRRFDDVRTDFRELKAELGSRTG